MNVGKPVGNNVRRVCCRARARTADIDRQLPAPRTVYQRISAAGARAAAAGSVMSRAEVGGSTRTGYTWKTTESSGGSGTLYLSISSYI